MHKRTEFAKVTQYIIALTHEVAATLNIPVVM